ncbi:TonB-dependent receptor [uncultured Fibrella sp.]|uniref:TonB-dependent receptor n=1 Tax=uncultured Fibrella sp. TaxID=1284596 RepID=UPI0035CC2E15
MKTLTTRPRPGHHPARPILSLLLFAASFSVSVAQSFTQTIRGTVVDAGLQTPLPGASVVLLGSEPLQGTTTDAEGTFRIPAVRVGRQSLRVSVVGYKERLLSNLTVDSGKELVLTIALDESVSQLAEVTIRPTVDKDKPLNELSTVSARTFSVEETGRFAAAINDPARMATAYAGVVGGNDGNNQIIIRGNAPNGLLWRMEGVEIPNPNHFAELGTSAGGVSILSAQLLANSDFLTGAFAAEYGNALSGVFDLRLRRGNNAKRESYVQAGVLGLDVSSEGPFSKKYKGSYLFNYRYSTLGLLRQVGFNLGSGTTTFQDFSFNVYLPTNRLGTFTLFGFGGLSRQDTPAKRDSTQWQYDFDRLNEQLTANTGAVGLTHTLNLGRRATLKTVALASAYGYTYQSQFLTDELRLDGREQSRYLNRKDILSSTLTYKLNARHTVRLGAIGARLGFSLNQAAYQPQPQQLEPTVAVADQTTQTVQAFGQWQFRPTEQLTLNAGAHYLRLLLNGRASIEPRAALRWAFREGQSLSLGYGLHSQVPNVGTLFSVVAQERGLVQANRRLGFTRAHHVVLGYDRLLTEALRLKVESYYQWLFDVPVSAAGRDAYSLLNQQTNFPIQRLVNAGTGRNYGLELTLEQFLKNNVYFLLSSSLYRSEYQGSDAIWRSTRFDGRVATSLLAGKEFIVGNSTLGLNVKLTYAGGYRDTPIDVAASRAQGQTVYVDALTNSLQLTDYLRPDLRVSWKKQRPHSTRTLSLDVQNLINRQNEFNRSFDPTSGTVRVVYQNGLLPVLSYRVAF